MLTTAPTLLCIALALTPPAEQPAEPTGRVIILPGIDNLRFYLYNFVGRIGQRYPQLQAEIRTWGPPLRLFDNLQNIERNRRTAEALAADITACRRAHPERTIDLVGFSGGGGIAILAVARLPDDIAVDRLILVAPAIARDYPLATEVMPHVRDVVINYASRRDLHLSAGTTRFGTIDRQHTPSAGFSGFEREHPRLIQVHWTPAMMATGHIGVHWCIGLDAWQRVYLLPALDRTRAVRATLALLPGE